MIKCNLHTHSTLCDGSDRLEDTVVTAIQKGFDAIGFSGHSFTDFDLSYCMSNIETDLYVTNIGKLKQKYNDQIQIYCGIEKDYFSTDDRVYDYIIGSVHYFANGSNMLPVDESIEQVKKATDEFFNGDIYACCEAYYQTVANLKKKTNCDIIGHFDLIKKYNKDGQLFDNNNPRYVNASMDAVNELIKTDVIFELNTSGKFYQGELYPSDSVLKQIAQKNGRVIITSDCHKKELLDYCFDEAQTKLKQLGFKTVCVIKNGKFVEQNL